MAPKQFGKKSTSRADEFGEESLLDVLIKRSGGVPMPPSMARLLLMVAGFAVVATIAAVSWATWPSDKSKVDEETLPIMRAEESPFKIKPEEPGGMAVPNKDSTIFETLNEEPEEKSVENLLEEPEVPVKKEEVFADDEDNEVAQVAESISQPEPTLVSKEEPVAPIKIVEEKPATAPAPVPVATKKEEPKAEISMSAGKSYVQFAAVKNDAEAKAKWSKLQSQYSVLKPLAMRVQKADLGSKGTFYRVQAGPMSLEQAQSVCEKVKSSKGDCLVIK
ncbi:MAG: SPOR domain-containing protein [Pseudobdellovibrionaceae bacterium]|jgi:hypothetical protein|nr:SPOR domain-containing protein [Pseudobdellovibrionaceae bacterium]